MTKLTENIIKKYYKEDSEAYRYLYTHSVAVTKLALKIAEHNSHLNPDTDFIRNAAMLHDIGIFMTNAPGIGCFGTHPYIAHGYLGRELLEKEGLAIYGLVCERHVGVGITLKEIEKYNLPLPKRDMIPVTSEEKIICYADKFYSKKQKYLTDPRPIEKTIRKLEKYGIQKIAVFKEFMDVFGVDYIY
jgi:uncharacterized protein